MKPHFIFFVICFIRIHAEERIAGGNPVELTEYPFATSLLSNGGSGQEFAHACGGSIITVNAILSAASCFFTNGTADEVSWWRARVGSVDSTVGGTIHFIRQITPHPNFSPETGASDVAVLRTTINIAFVANTVQPATLAGGAYTLSTNQPVWAIGWGITSNTGQLSQQLRSVQFWVVDQQTCTSRYSELGFTVNNDMVCTGWLDVGVLGQCQGDSGSPLVIDGVVVGVHSWAEGCADSWYPGVNTRVASFIRWIVDTAIAA